MSFIRQASAIAVLVTLTLWLQSAGIAMLIHWGRSHEAGAVQRLDTTFRSALLIVRITNFIVGLHMLEILLRAGFYRWNCFATWESAFYFSAASYSTLGCGDFGLPGQWRTMGPVESVTGVLMCGVSVSFLFAIVTRLVGREARLSSQPTKRPLGMC
jgi:voltage-gated potassium channel